MAKEVKRIGDLSFPVYFEEDGVAYATIGKEEGGGYEISVLQIGSGLIVEFDNDQLVEIDPDENIQLMARVL